MATRHPAAQFCCSVGSLPRKPSGLCADFVEPPAFAKLRRGKHARRYTPADLCFTAGTRRTLCAITVNDEKTSPDSSSKRAARFRLIGIIVLVLGLGSAGVVYWLGTRSPDVTDDLSMVGYNKAQTRQMAMLYGKMGPVIEEWFDDLKQPGTQAEIIVAISILVAIGCFYIARLSGHDNDPR